LKFLYATLVQQIDMPTKMMFFWCIFLVFLLGTSVREQFTCFAHSPESDSISNDLNGDGVVNMRDLAIVAHAWGSYQGSANWKPEADLNNDGVVNMLDIALIAQDFGIEVLRYNLAVIPDDWSLTFGQGPQIIRLDYDFYRTSPPSIRLEPHKDGVDINTNRECDGTWLNVKPADHIVAKCWIFAGDSGAGDTSPYGGGRLGLDLYAHTSQGYGIVDSYPHDGEEHLASVVRWGTKTWTQKVWDIIVPSTFYTRVWREGGVFNCDPVQTDSFVLWLDAREVSDPGLVWFADAELYINPS
jgi:hypothetical protein